MSATYQYIRRDQDRMFLELSHSDLEKAGRNLRPRMVRMVEFA
jgi:hypothetical protein